MTMIRRKSGWTFTTSATGGASVEVISAGGGAIDLSHPQQGDITLHYIGLGIGLSIGLSTFGNLNASIAPGNYPNMGSVYILDGFGGRGDLKRSDMTGVFSVVEATGGFFGPGASAAVMILGLSKDQQPAAHFVLGLTLGALGEFLSVASGTSGTAMIVFGGAATYTGLGGDFLSGLVW